MAVLGSPDAAVVRAVAGLLTMPILGSPVVAAAARCVSSLLTMLVLGSPVESEWLTWLAVFEAC
ncbi:hypothetical protein EDB87DRAFT_1690262 [Lactarius vividus]|nr:hypothetical protein EDB87DRAFT_1690262 [Lactarius vividus]